MLRYLRVECPQKIQAGGSDRRRIVLELADKEFEQADARSFERESLAQLIDEGRGFVSSSHLDDGFRDALQGRRERNRTDRSGLDVVFGSHLPDFGLVSR